MGSRTHLQPVGQSIRQLGARSLSGVLEVQAQSKADNRYAIYDKNLGGGIHEVHNQCNETPYKVGSIARDLTFSKGQVVVLASNAGNAGEVIVGVAPPSLAGADVTNVDVTLIGVPWRPPAISGVCPAPIRGKTYLALGVAGSTGYASIYFDGVHGHRLPDLASSDVSLVNAQRLSTRGDTVLALAPGDGFSTIKLLTWHAAAGTADVLELTGVPDGELGGPVWAGAIDDAAYGVTGAVFPDRHIELQIYRFPVGVTDSRPLASFAIGPPLVDAGPYSTAVEVGFSGAYRPGILPTGPDLQLIVERHDLGRNVLLDFSLAGRTWRLDASRAAPSSMLGGDGRPLSNTRALVAQGLQLSVVPSWPASPSFDLLPADWTLNGPPLFSTSPDLAQLALYPFWPGSDSHMLLRMLAAPLTIPSGCPIPAVAVQAAPWGSAWEAASEPGHRPTVMIARD